ncbi:LOW QUALITY PROTEIN: protein PET117 homolog, mitochondrial [Carettochelys insculpta]|uniref:LOW QUALITY PROTEIN: protein PET117 homolog, mitochondrial n=1 Tax=Carettochelys insculpta TaxID=44489 RepID=UPI003EBCA4A7
MHGPLELCGSRSAAGRWGRGMSTVSKVALGLSVLLSAGTVVAVHVQQRRVRERLHEGVIRDLERQSRKLENIRLLQEQIALTKQLEAEREKMLIEEGSQQP